MGGLPNYPILMRLESIRETKPGQWIAKCPSHDDSTESLSISVGDNGGLLLHCHAKCEKVEILRSINATFGDLFPATHGKNSHASADRSADRSAGPAPKLVAAFDYRDASGTLLYQSCRYEPGPNGRKKTFKQRAPKPDGKGWNYSVRDIPAVLYRLPELLDANPGIPVFIAEGERKVETLRSAGFVATCKVGGAGGWQPSYSETLRGRHVIILPDNDDPGRKHAAEVAAALHGIAASVRILELPGLPAKGDIVDWVKIDGNTPAKLREMAEACPHWSPESAVPATPVDPAPPALTPAVPATPAALAVPSAPPTEHDDDPHRLARLFLSRYSNPDGPTLRFWRDSWWRWDGQIYLEVPTGEIRASLTQSIKSEFDRIVAAKLAAGPLLGDNGPPRPIKVTGRLISDTVQALAGLVMLPGSVDAPAWLDSPAVPASDRGDVADYLCMANGILSISGILAEAPDLASVLTPHTPAFFTRNRIPYDFNLSAECPRWNHFLATSLQGDAESIAMLQEWFGYCLTPDTSLQRFLMFEGEGSNGKSVICAALTALLGQSNVSHVPLEMFGKDFVLTQTLGKLANIAAEVGELDKMAEGVLKSFTAGDRMTFNRKRKDLIEAVPTARLVLSTNNLPRVSDKSNGLWRRMLLLELTYVVPEEERIIGMDKSSWWIKSGELPGILLWSLAGLQELRRYRKFTIPDRSRARKEAYQRESNPLRIFLTERYEETNSRDDTVPTDELYKAYSEWCKANGLHAMSSVSLGKEINRIFRKVVRQKVRDGFSNRCWGYNHLREKQITDDEEAELPASF